MVVENTRANGENRVDPAVFQSRAWRRHVKRQQRRRIRLLEREVIREQGELPRG